MARQNRSNRHQYYRQQVENDDVGKKPRTLKLRKEDMGEVLTSQLHEVRDRALRTLDYAERFDYEDFYTLFVGDADRERLRAAVLAAVPYSYYVNHINIVIGGLSITVRTDSSKMAPVLPRYPEFQYDSPDVELVRRYINWLHNKRDMMVGLARAEVLIINLINELEPKQAVYMLPALQALARGTKYEQEFQPAGAPSRMPTLSPYWRNCCKLVATTLAQAQLLPETPDGEPGLLVHTQIKELVLREGTLPTFEVPAA